MANVEMIVDSVRVSLMNYQRVVILKEKGGVRHLPIWIGPAEADAIDSVIQEGSRSSPSPHDFTCAAIAALGGSVQSVIIDRLENATFYAKVVLATDRGQNEIDCRPSDALVVAVRQGVSIFADEQVMKKAGIDLPVGPEQLLESSLEEAPVGQRAGKGHLGILSDDVQDVLDASEAEARRLEHGYVCTGHLLLALVKARNTATNVLRNAGAEPGRIQLDIQTLMKKEDAIEGGGFSLTPAVRQAIEISIAESKRLGSEEVLPEHVLLGLARATDGIAANHLERLGITPETVYAELVRLYAGTGRGV